MSGPHASTPERVTRNRLSIVVPTYNERERLPDLVEAIFSAYAAERVDGELVIVDDNSPDGTGELAETLARRYPITVVHRTGKLGLGTAVIDGFSAGRAPIVGVMDADMSHPPTLVPRMLAVMEETSADAVVASRYIPDGGTRNWPLGRLAMSRLACLLARGVTPVRDAASGFFLVRRELVRDVHIRAGGFKICLELLVRGRPASIVEVPYTFENRTAGKSKMNLGEALGYIDQLRRLRRFVRTGPAHAPRYRAVTAEELAAARLQAS
jgi:dolichol-phosphate mannosyltransferase